MSQQVELEERIRLLEQQLDQAQRMTALGELSGTLTHEFNNVLMKFIGYAQMGLRHKDEETRDKSLQTILDIANRTKKMCASILGMARNRSDEKEPTSLAALTDDVLLLLERELNKYRVSVDRQYAEVPEALVSGNQIQQVLLNLLINARQAMPQGGTLTIRLGYDEANKLVDLTIRDTGTGIPQEKLAMIFEPYYSTKKPDATGRGGTGLGLAMVKTIIEEHGGRIRVESSVGKGTAFTLRLPVATAGVVPASKLSTLNGANAKV